MKIRLTNNDLFYDDIYVGIYRDHELHIFATAQQNEVIKKLSSYGHTFYESKKYLLERIKDINNGIL